MQIGFAYTHELRHHTDLLLNMLLMEDSWQSHRIHTALKGKILVVKSSELLKKDNNNNNVKILNTQAYLKKKKVYLTRFKGVKTITKNGLINVSSVWCNYSPGAATLISCYMSIQN